MKAADPAPISPATWQRLLAGARRYLALAPWGWMYDNDLFGVTDPELGETGYCSVMGRAQTQPGLALFRGPGGLMDYEQVQAAEFDDPGFNTSPNQDCLLLRFWREGIPAEELAQWAQEGFVWEGQGVMPQFLDFSPGLVPAAMADEQQARWMIRALEQAEVVALALRENGDLLDHVEAGQSTILVRKARPDGAGGWTWFTAWEPQEASRAEPRPVVANKLYLRSNCRNLPQRDKRWLGEVFYFPKAVAEGERPFFPQLVVLAEMESGTILRYALYGPGDIYEQLQFFFVEAVKEAGYLPAALVASSDYALAWWQHIGEAIPLRLLTEAEPPFLADFRRDLFGSLSI